MIRTFLTLCFLICSLHFQAQASAFFNNRISVQGYFKSAGVAVQDATGFPMKVTLKKNSTAVWCQILGASVPVIKGVFSITMTGIANCSGLTNNFDASLFDHAANSDVFSTDVTVDVLKDGFGGSDDATFAGIEMLASPMAIRSQVANSAESLSTTLGITQGGTGSTSAASARTNLGLGNLSVLNLSGNAAEFLKGDGSFGTPGSIIFSGDLSGSPAAASVDKIKGRNVSSTIPTANQVLTWNNGSSIWEPQTPTSAPVSSVAGRTGAVTLLSTDISDADSANTSDTIVKRDASGDFSAGTITATLSGNATNVTGTVAIANGGTGSTTAATARSSLGAAASGVNTDITSINGSARQGSILMAPATAGTGAAYTLTNSPALSALAAGQTQVFRTHAVNSAAATVNIDGLGARPLFSRLTGLAVAAGDLPTTKSFMATYDGTNWQVEIPPRYFSATALNCGASIAARSFVTCPNIAATNVNAGDIVHCSPSADPGAGQVGWSVLATAGNISIRLGCSNGASTCALTSRNWKCAVQK